MGKVFLKLLKSHFPASRILHKIFNKNNVTNFYSAFFNSIYSLISSHNKNILNSRTVSFRCNSLNIESCHLNEDCLTLQLVNRATVTNAVNKDTKNTLAYRIPPLKKEISTTKEIASIKNTLTAQN